jgi:hypothetical protein
MNYFNILVDIFSKRGKIAPVGSALTKRLPVAKMLRRPLR